MVLEETRRLIEILRLARSMRPAFEKRADVGAVQRLLHVMMEPGCSRLANVRGKWVTRDSDAQWVEPSPVNLTDEGVTCAVGKGNVRDDGVEWPLAQGLNSGL